MRETPGFPSRSILPTQLGLDSDNEKSAGEVGKVGVAIDSLADMETIFQGIPLDKISTSFTINSTAAILYAMYVAVGKKTRRFARSADRHHPERHPERIRFSRHMDISRPNHP